MPIEDKVVKEFVAHVINNEQFQQHIRMNVLPKMPNIRPYEVDDEKSVERWKADSYKMEGFKLCFSHVFGIDITKFK